MLRLLFRPPPLPPAAELGFAVARQQVQASPPPDLTHTSTDRVYNIRYTRPPRRPDRGHVKI